MKTLNAIIAGAALYLAGCGVLPSLKDAQVYAPSGYQITRETTRANKELIRFSTARQINRRYGFDVVKSVDKYLVPGAVKVIVHWRQDHFVIGMSEEDEEVVRKCQYNLETVLGEMAEHIHNEGIASKYDVKSMISLNIFIRDVFKQAIRDGRRDLKKLEHKLETAELAEDISEIEYDIQEKKEDIERWTEYMDVDVLYGAVLKLAVENKVKMLPAEKRDFRIDEIVKKLKEKEKTLGEKEVVEAILDGREDLFLEIAALQRRLLVHVVYGGAHAWGGKDSCGPDYNLDGRLSLHDNIAEWNKKHPECMMSLIEITPYSYHSSKAIQVLRKQLMKN
jgi:hypothetical protein